jgi:hypothetical protein
MHDHGGDVAIVEPDVDPSADRRGLPGDDPSPVPGATDLVPGATDLRHVLDDPRLVLTGAYIGADRRRRGARAGVARATWVGRRRLLRLDLLIVLALVALVVGAVLLVANGGQALRPAVTTAAPLDGLQQARPHTPTTAPPTTAPPTTAPPTTAPPAPVAPTVAAAPAAATTDAASAGAPDSPEAMGAAALSLIRYPWQQLPGYSIDFLPISDAPSPGFYGNTAFAWGKAGGTSSLYVYPGETVQRLAGITAFEIGHEVDAAYVEPLGGHDAIASILGIHPASWAPQCDCAEQGYLSGWYAAAFSSYWSPGVGDWSSLAPVPTGTTLAAVEPWLDPRVP